VPLLWWNRIVAHSSKLKGWNITPSHFIDQDLTEVWITDDNPTSLARDSAAR
jgi:peptide/nickel transport system substrate-binding protein